MVHRNRKGSKLQAPSMARGWPRICTNWKKQLTRRQERKRHCETTPVASNEHPRKRGRHDNSRMTNQQHHQLQELDGSHNIPSTSSSVDPQTGHEFEVFLSFRGSDNRKTFTDCLYHSLTDAGIRTFRDNEELRVGEEIGPELMKSIKQSKISIPIFSKDYASSKWCLKEVAEMVKCMKETKQLIMPVFLDVTPDEVQHQTGSFAEPFARHEKRFGPETVRGWRYALNEVVKLKGLESNAVANGYIVEQENRKEPGLRSRLWRSEDAVDVLVEKQASSKVEAICLDHCELADVMFVNLSRLRFLELNDVRLSGNFQQPFHHLRWLGWHTDHENESPPENLTLNNLIVLDLSRSLITGNWIGWSLNKTWLKLKVLNLGNCQISRTPDFSAFPSLEILNLASCRDLVYVDPSIGLLKNLILLDLGKCHRLKALPKQLGSLESLVELLIDYTRVKEIPISGGMKKLEILSANYCQKLKEIPASIGSLENLKRLHLEKCASLQPLPELPSGLISLKVGSKVELRGDCLSKLKELEELSLEAVRISTLSEEMSSFLRLEEIYLSHCVRLKCIPNLPSSLSVLRIKYCHSLRRLPDLSNLKNLSRLVVIGSPIKEIEGLGDLLSLKFLAIRCYPLIKLDGLERLEFLNYICVSCSQVERLPNLSKLKSLRWLDLSFNHKLVEIQNLGRLKKLKELDIRLCSSLEFLGELPDCLERLIAVGCTRLRNLANLSKLQGPT